jgi:hypothetical protein
MSPTRAALVGACLVGLAACATTPTAPTAKDLNKPGYATEIKDGRLWVFRDGSKELAEFRQRGEPAHIVTRIGAGPNGMTIRSSEVEIIDGYLAAK